MKQNEIMPGNKYILCRMQYRGLPELNGKEVIIVGVKKGNKKRPAFGIGNKSGKGPAHYKTDIGVYVMACNLKIV